jgi:hypothetical protein
MTTETKQKLKHFVARIEWHNTAWVDVAVSAPTLEEACKLAYEEADYDSQRTYDDSGESFISKIAPCGTREAAEDCEQRGNLWDRNGLTIPTAHRDPLDCAIDERDELRAALAALDKWSGKIAGNAALIANAPATADAARAMLAALRQVQGCPQAAPWLARGPADGINTWDAIATAIAQAEAAGITGGES